MAQNERMGVDVVLNDSNFRSGVGRMVTELNRVNRAAGDTTQAGNKMGTGFASSFKAMIVPAAVIGGFAAVGKAITGAVSVGMDYTKQMSKVEAISGSTALQMAELGSNARKLGADTRWSATNVAEAYEYMAMAGWNSNQMLDASLPLLNLATAGALDLGKAADIVTDTMTPFGLAASEAGRVADVFAVAQSKANLNVEMLGETMKYAAPIAATFGANLEETTVIAMQFANGGIKASMAGTALRAGLSRLAAPPKAAANALDAMGVSTKKADGNMKDLGTIIGEMSPKFNAMSESQQVATAKAIFGEEAYAGWVMVLKNGLPEFQRMKELLDTSAGSADVMAKIMANNLSGAVDNASSALENLGLILFSRIEGGLVAATNGGIGFLETLTSSIDPTNTLVEATKLLQQAEMQRSQELAILNMKQKEGKLVGDAYTQAVAETNQRYTENTTASGILKQKMAELDAQYASGALDIDAYNKKKDEAKVFSENMGASVEKEKKHQEALGEKIKWLQGVFEQLWKVVKPLWDDMAKFIGEKIAYIKEFIDKNGHDIEIVWNAVWSIIKFFTETIWEGIKDIISGAIDMIMGIIKFFAGILEGDWSKMWEGLKQITSGALDLIWGIFQAGFGSLIKAPLKLGKELLKWGKDVFGKLGSSIKGYLDDIVSMGSRGWTKFVDDAKDIMGTVKKWITNPIDEAGKVLSRIDWGHIGRKLIQSLIDGIWSMSRWLGSTVSSVGSMLNPLKWFKAPDTPIGRISGGHLQSPDGNYAPSMNPTGGAMMMAPSGGIAGLSAVMDMVNDSISSLNSISAASSRGGSYTRTEDMANTINTPQSGQLTIEVPVYLDGTEMARSQAELNGQEITRFKARQGLGRGGSKHFR